MNNGENNDLREVSEELKNINVNDAEELQILEDTGDDEITEEELQAKYDDILNKAKSTGFKNQPYKKIINEEGDLANPISKYNPYLHLFPSRSQRRKMLKLGKEPKNNKKGIRLVVTKVGVKDFIKTKVVRQHIPKSYTPVFSHCGLFIENELENNSRTITHNLIK